MNKLTLGIGSILAGLAVIAGAFASHSLRGYLTDSALSIWQSAVRYQMYHSLALLLVGILMRLEKSVSPWLNISAIAFIIGIVLFSGSLYTLSLTGIKWFGMITPIGGVAFILGWICLATFSWKSTSSAEN
jgi:uncharacterized membrane protein YgdD (TMEM256/DUF423 family)